MDDISGIPTSAQESLNFLKSSLDSVKEVIELNAELARVKYTALIKNGFSKEEALELTKTLF